MQILIVSMDAKTRPSKTSLLESAKRKKAARSIPISFSDLPKESIKIWFGKYKDRTLTSIHKENKNYFPWIYDNFEFNGERMKILQREIKLLLKL